MSQVVSEEGTKHIDVCGEARQLVEARPLFDEEMARLLSAVGPESALSNRPSDYLGLLLLCCLLATNSAWAKRGARYWATSTLMNGRLTPGRFCQERVQSHQS